MMKKKRYISLGACVLFCGIAAAESRASSEEDIQKNLNQLIATKQCPNCDLRGAALTRMDLQGANLQGADLSNAKLSLTNLSKADLRNAVLRNAVLGGTDFAGADLRGADLTGAQLAGAYLKEAILDKELIQDTPSEPGAQVLPEEENEARAEKLEAISSGTEDPEPPAVEEKIEVAPSSVEEKQEEVVFFPDNFVKPEGVADSETPVSVALEPHQEWQTEEKKKPPVTLPDIEGRAETTVRSKELVPLQEVQVEMAEKVGEVDDISVIETEQKEEYPDKAVERESSLWSRMTTLFGSGDEKKTGLASKQAEEPAGAYTVETFVQSQARLRSLVNTLLEERRCVACDLAGADLRGKDLEEVDLERADLSGAQLEKADLRAANLKGVNFIDANLKNADLRKADLYLADFTNADLTGTSLERALLDSVDFTDAIGRPGLEDQEEQ